MTWDASRISGPWPVPVYGAPATDPITGRQVKPVAGYQGDAQHPAPNSYCIVMVPEDVTPALQKYVQASVPDGLPIFFGRPDTVVLCFPTEAVATAQTDLAKRWS